MSIIILVSDDNRHFSQIADTFEDVEAAITHAKDIESDNKFVSVEEATETGTMVHYQSGGV